MLKLSLALLGASIVTGCTSDPAIQTPVQNDSGGAGDPRAGAGGDSGASQTPAGSTAHSAGGAGTSATAGRTAAGMSASTAGMSGASAGMSGASAGMSGASAGMSGASAGMQAPEPEEPTKPRSIATAELSAATQAWWSYERAGQYSVVTSKVQVPTRDGTPIGCTLSRPATSGAAVEGKFPGLIVEFTPYVLSANTYYLTEAAFFVQRGYNTLVCTVRGTGESGGTWQNAFSPQDGRDAHDLVEWLATQSFSDGRIGQLGESYGGGTSYGAAVEQPPHLKAIAPMQPPANLYDDVIYPGGIKSTEDGTIDNWPPIGELLSQGAISAQAEYEINRAHPTFDSYWQERSLVGRHSSIQVPVLTIGGWQDGFFRSGTLRNIEGALDRTWAIYGPWTHMPPVDLDICDTACVEDPLPGGVILAWFDHWVMELDGVPIPEKPTFVSYENPKGGSRGWRELSAWVPEGADPMTFQLGEGGTLSDTASASGATMFREPGEPTAAGAAATFTTAALESDRVLIGAATLTLRAKLSTGDANFYVELLDVDASDREVFVDDGYLKASHRKSHITPEPVPVGEATDYTIAIRPQHHRFAAGHRLRLRISGGRREALVQPEAVDVTLETGSLRVPGFAAEL